VTPTHQPHPDSPTPQPGPGPRPGPGPVVHGHDGHLLDPYNLLDHPHPPHGTPTHTAWAARRIEQAHAEATTNAEIIAAADALDPADTSTHATHLRAIADSARAHTEHQTRAHTWATAALTADPTLTNRLPPEYHPTTTPNPTTEHTADPLAETTPHTDHATTDALDLDDDYTL
jgi:hypothetical protein